jgi:hypothetical protein
MKKQLLIAAVAATMTSAAMADISIAGAAKVNYTYTDSEVSTSAAASTNSAFSREMDLKLTGKSGATTVVMNFANDTAVSGNSGLVAEDSYVATSVGDISIKAGAWSNGNNQMRAKARGDSKFAASTSFNGVKVTYESSNETVGTTDAVTLSGDISGVAVKFKEEGHADSYSVSTTIAGVKIAQSALNSDTANSDRVMTSIGGSFNGVDVTYTTIKADSAATINGEGIYNLRDASKANVLSAGDDVAFLQLSTTIAGNSVSFMNGEVDAVATASDINVKEITVTRAMAAGTTFEATYTMLDFDNAAINDRDILDLELAVKF